MEDTRRYTLRPGLELGVTGAPGAPGAPKFQFGVLAQARLPARPRALRHGANNTAVGRGCANGRPAHSDFLLFFWLQAAAQRAGAAGPVEGTPPRIGRLWVCRTSQLQRRPRSFSRLYCLDGEKTTRKKHELFDLFDFFETLKCGVLRRLPLPAPLCTHCVQAGSLATRPRGLSSWRAPIAPRLSLHRHGRAADR